MQALVKGLCSWLDRNSDILETNPSELVGASPLLGNPHCRNDLSYACMHDTGQEDGKSLLDTLFLRMALWHILVINKPLPVNAVNAPELIAYVLRLSSARCI